jgi:hypothetical protein
MSTHSALIRSLRSQTDGTREIALAIPSNASSLVEDLRCLPATANLLMELGRESRKVQMSRSNFVAALFLSVAGSITPLCAQNQSKLQSPPHDVTASQTPTAKASDVASPDAILAAVYDVISGPAAQKRDWGRFNSLFYPGARLVRTAPKQEGGFSATTFGPQDYVDRASSYFEKNGFFEREIARHTERWGNILHAFSTYESRHEAKDGLPFARGINSFQLFFDGSRWWVLTIFWQEETSQNPLPPEFLPAPH